MSSVGRALPPDLSNQHLYMLKFGLCSFCGRTDRVVASERVDEESPPGICEDCAWDAAKMLGAI